MSDKKKVQNTKVQVGKLLESGWYENDMFITILHLNHQPLIQIQVIDLNSRMKKVL